jgi:hypothetical protein
MAPAAEDLPPPIRDHRVESPDLLVVRVSSGQVPRDWHLRPLSVGRGAGTSRSSGCRVHLDGSGRTAPAATAATVNPRSAAERCSWTRRSPSLQVTDLHTLREATNPWTHVRTVFESCTSRDADEARTRARRPVITTRPRRHAPQAADLRREHLDPQFRLADHGQAVSIPSGTPRLA